MTKTQKIIKNLAIAFATFLIFMIASFFMNVLLLFGNTFEKKDNLKTINSNIEAKILNIEVTGSNLIIKESTTFKVETNNKYVSVKQMNDSLTIKEEKHVNLKNNDIIIFVPKNIAFNIANIDIGVGQINIENLTSKSLNLDLGAGNIIINNLKVLEETNISLGIGEINVSNSTFNNLEFESGIGTNQIDATIIGDNKLELGIGEITLNLKETLNDYKIKINNGIGPNIIEGNKISNDTYYGNGSNIIDIDNGIGKVEIK